MWGQTRRVITTVFFRSLKNSLADANQLQAIRHTTVLCVRKDNNVVMAADGQVTVGSNILKPNVHKLRRINEKVIGGFAGSTADAFSLMDNLEIKIEAHPDQILRAAVELAKLWRTDKFLRRLDAMLVVADKDTVLEITGQGDVLEPHDGIVAIGSGANFAVAASRALIDIPGLGAKEIAEKAMKIAADSDIYTNHNLTWELLDIEAIKREEEKKEKELEESVSKSAETKSE